jgi:dTDP-4-dehydrorhamnose reductase
VTGATGLLGSALTPLLRERGWTVVTHARSARADHAADLTRRADVQAMLDVVRPDVIVNLAALTDVDACERDPARAYALNVEAVESIAGWIAGARPACHLLHISTDQVYDGPGLHAEDEVCIRNTYAFSKIAAELAALRVNATVLRTNFFGMSRCEWRSSLSDWLYRSLRERQPIRVFDDILFSPLGIDTLTSSIEAGIERKPRGVFNLGSRDGMSKADFAFAFAAVLGLPTDTMTRAPSDDAKLLARRPQNMLMDVRRYERAMDVSLPSLRDEIERIGRSYRERA